MKCADFNFSSSTCTSVYKGYDFTKTLTFRNSDKTAIDLTNLTFVMIIKDSLGGSTLLTLNEVGDDVSTGLYLPLPLTGQINLLITDADSAGIAVGKYPYEIRYTQSNGLQFPFMEGDIEFCDRGF